MCQWWLLSSCFQCGYVAFELFSPLPNRTLPRITRTMTDSSQLRSSIPLPGYHADFFTFAEHVTFELSTDSPCPVISSRREGNINKQIKIKVSSHSIVDQSVRIALPVIGHSAASARSGWRRDFLSNRKSSHPVRCRKLLAMLHYGYDKKGKTSSAFGSCCLCQSVEAHKARLNGFRSSRGCRLSRSFSGRVQLSAINCESSMASTVAPKTASTVELNTTSAVEFNTAFTVELNTANRVEASLRRNGDGQRRHASQKYVGVVLGSVR